MQLQVATSGEVLARWRDPGATLTAAERQRAAAYRHAGAADDFVAAHLLARECVTALTGSATVEIVQRCETCGGDHGKPTVAGDPEVQVSWSHSRGSVAAVADRVAVGIDLETRTRSGDVARLLHRTATPGEAADVAASDDPELAYLRMWVAKESLVKIGALTLGDFGAVDVRSGRYAGAELSVRELPGCVLGIARRP